MRSFLAAAFISAFFLTSCDNSSHTDVDASLPTFTNAPVAPVTPQITTANDSLLPEKAVENIAPTDIQQAPAEVYSAAGLNPPHGQPGHDCAIAVGAPLNGSPAANPVQASPSMSFPSAAPAPVSAAPGGPRLNPPHGQPGHDCAVQVGAPLG